MQRAVILGLLILVGSVGSVWAEDGSVIVAGEGSVEVTPDVAHIGINVLSKSKEARVARKRNAEESNKLSATLKDVFKIDAKDIQTTTFDLSPEYRYEQNGKNILVGFRVSHTMRVKIRTLDKLGEIIDKVAVSAPGQEEKMVSIQGVEFGSEKPEAHEHKALENAVANAFSKASTLTKAAKRNLGAVVGIKESKVQGYEPVMMKSARYSMDPVAGEATNVSPGQIRVTANVVVEFDLK